MSIIKKQLGRAGEDLVAQKLKKDGFIILDRNYRKQYGEIDLIAKKKDQLVFVEVKMRKNPLFDLSSVITPSKQKKIITVAKQYIATHNYTNTVCQFDVALIVGTIPNAQLTYIPNAFTEQNY